MTETLDTYIKTPAPPKNEDAQYVYNEQQFSGIEKALKKHHDKILDVSKTSKAQYENEVIVRADADSAIVKTIETLTAAVQANDTNTQAQIQNIQTAQADVNSATAEQLTTLEAKVDTGDANTLALIQNEAKARTTKDDSLASQLNSLKASVTTSTKELWSSISNEQKVRSTADQTEAIARQTLSSYVGLPTGTTYGATISEMLGTKAAADGASYNWTVQGKLGTDSAGNAGIALTGVQKFNPDGTTSTYSKLIINANTEINGNLMVTGSITGAKIATGSSGNGVTNSNINNYAVTNSAYNSGINSPANWVGVTLTLRKDARVSILVSYAGGDDQGINGSDGNLTAYANVQSFTNNTQPITHSMVAIAGTQTYVSGQFVLNGIIVTYQSNPSTMLTFYTVPADGSYVFSAFASNGFNKRVSILVMELSK